MAEILQLPFVVHALVAGGCAAVVSAACGYFLVSQGNTFAAHALPNIGFAGAAGAVLLGVEPVYGLFAFTAASGTMMAWGGTRRSWRDASVGAVMTTALGLGLLFVALYRGNAQRVYRILFGTILGISAQEVIITASGAALALASLLVIYRPLLYSTHDPDSAEARGVPRRLLSIWFMVTVAVAVSLSVQVMGTLLIFALLVGPPATAARIVREPSAAIALAAGLGVVCVTGGILLSAATGGLPVSFLVAMVSFLGYLTVRIATGRARKGA